MYVNVSVPAKPTPGVYVIVPSPLSRIVPFEGFVADAMLNVSPLSGSLSFASTFTVTGVTALVAAASFSAIGAAFHCA